jgi:uncharacterized membrane protein YdjX (TVP38/TMEM64 family)
MERIFDARNDFSAGLRVSIENLSFFINKNSVFLHGNFCFVRYTPGMKRISRYAPGLNYSDAEPEGKINMFKRPSIVTGGQQRNRTVVGGAIFILAFVLIFWYVGLPMLRFVSLPDQFRLWVNGQGIWGRLVFVGMMILQVFVAIIPGEPLEIGAGYAFGMLEGTLLCLAGAVMGSLLIFLFVRRFGVRAAEIFFSGEKLRSIKFLQNKKHRELLIFLIVLIPGTPKDLLSYFVGLTDMKLSTWLLITAVGRIPSVVTSTIGGDALGMQNYSFAAIALMATLLISGAGLLVYHRICSAHEEKNNGTD